jgi:Ca2+-binding RTX toxin-like protein
MGIAGHIVTVSGDLNEPNTIIVGLSPGGTSIYAELSYPTRKGLFSKTKIFPLTDKIKRVNLVSGKKNDLITVDQTNGSFPFLTYISTKSGADTVMGGDEPDRITCGSGTDSINSGNGNDTLLGGRGPDTLIGGNGNDHIRANSKHDLLTCGSGDTTFVDPDGSNTLLGGTGNDTFTVINLKLDPDNNYNPAKDKLIKYVPPAQPSQLLNDILNGLLDYEML